MPKIEKDTKIVHVLSDVASKKRVDSGDRDKANAFISE